MSKLLRLPVVMDVAAVETEDADTDETSDAVVDVESDELCRLFEMELRRKGSEGRR